MDSDNSVMIFWGKGEMWERTQWEQMMTGKKLNKT